MYSIYAQGLLLGFILAQWAHVSDSELAKPQGLRRGSSPQWIRLKSQECEIQGQLNSITNKPTQKFTSYSYTSRVQIKRMCASAIPSVLQLLLRNVKIHEFHLSLLSFMDLDWIHCVQQLFSTSLRYIWIVSIVLHLYTVKPAHRRNAHSIDYSSNSAVGALTAFLNSC